MWVYETYVPYDDLRAAVAARFVFKKEPTGKAGGGRGTRERL